MRTLFVILLFVLAADADVLRPEDKKCLDVATEVLKAGETLFAYSSERKPKWLETLFIFDGATFKDSDGRHFKGIKEVVQVGGKSEPVSFGAHFERMGTDRCIWFGKLSNAKSGPFEIFSFPKAAVNTRIDEQMRALFYSINTTCINQGHWPPGQESLCTKPTLKATSDLNGNGRNEFWFTTPHLWDTGFAVAEIDGSGKKLNTIADKCMSCD